MKLMLNRAIEASLNWNLLEYFYEVELYAKVDNSKHRRKMHKMSRLMSEFRFTMFYKFHKDFIVKQNK